MCLWGQGKYGVCAVPLWGKGLSISVCVCVVSLGEGDKKALCAVCVISGRCTRVCVASVRRGVNRGALGSQWPEGDVGSSLSLWCKNQVQNSQRVESGVAYATPECWEPAQDRCPRRLVQPLALVSDCLLQVTHGKENLMKF